MTVELPSPRDAKYPHLLEMLEAAYAVPLSGGMSGNMLMDFSGKANHATMESPMVPTLAVAGKHGRCLTDATDLGVARCDPLHAPAFNSTNELTSFYWGSYSATSVALLDVSPSSNLGSQLFVYSNTLEWRVWAGGRTGWDDPRIDDPDTSIPSPPGAHAGVYSSTRGQYLYRHGSLVVANAAYTGDFNTAGWDRISVCDLYANTWGYKGSLTCAYVWSRALTSADMMLLHHNPLALFESKRKSIVTIRAATVGVHYVASDGTASWWQSDSSSSPCSLETARTNAVAGDTVKIKSGTYTLPDADWVPTNIGTITDPIIWEGVDASWASIDNGRTDTLELDDTDFPVITITYSRKLGSTAVDFHIFKSLRFNGQETHGMVSLGDDSMIVNCYLYNSRVSTQVGILSLGDRSLAVNCDMICTYTSTGAGNTSVNLWGDYSAVIGCRIRPINPISLAGINCRLIHCLIYESSNTTNAVAIHADSTGVANVSFNTIVDSAGDAISLPNADVAGVPTIVGNMITDNGGWGINNLYSGTADRMVYAVGNRFRDNTSGNYNGISADCPTYDDELTDTGGPETDYVDAASDNYQTIALSPAVGHVLGQWNAGWCKELTGHAGPLISSQILKSKLEGLVS